MGWGRYFLLGDWGQQMDLEEQQAEIQRVRHEMRLRSQRQKVTSQTLLQQLQNENDELKLYLVALVRLMVNKKLTSFEEIEAIVNTIDSEDGRVDGKLSGKVKTRVKQPKMDRRF